MYKSVPNALELHHLSSNYWNDHTRKSNNNSSLQLIPETRDGLSAHKMKWCENSLSSIFHFNDPIMSYFCTCHDSSAVMTCTKLWHDEISSYQARITSIFTRFGSWAHKLFCKMDPWHSGYYPCVLSDLVSLRKLYKLSNLWHFWPLSCWDQHNSITENHKSSWYQLLWSLVTLETIIRTTCGATSAHHNNSRV